jgi:hypothetical protein
MNFFVSLGLILGWHVALAQESAQRDPRVPYSFYESKAFELLHKSESARSTIKSARPFTRDASFEATEWTEAQLAEGFEKIRDERFQFSNRDETFARRLTWLYPQDGCFSRAAQVNILLRAAGFPVPKKVFAFGELKVNTPYASDGDVTWWYHVASLVEVDGVAYVLDPAVNSSGPVTLETWLTLMGEIETIKVAICAAGAVFPKDRCDRKFLGEDTGRAAQRSYLNKEWDNLLKLGLDPWSLLGEAPPWSLPVSLLLQQ